MLRSSHRSPLVVLLAAGAALAVAAPSASTAKSPTRCSQLKGKDLYPKNPRLKLVVRSRPFVNDVGYEGTRNVWRACTGRHGRVRVVEVTGEDGYSTSYASELQSAGRYFLMNVTNDGVDRSYTRLRRYDAKTGRSDGLYAEDDGPIGFSPDDVVLDGSGAVAILFGTSEDDEEAPDNGPADVPAGSRSFVQVFPAIGGRSKVIDTGGDDVNTLRLSGGVITWKHGTEERRYQLRAQR